MHTVDNIIVFLDENFGRSVRIKDYFPDTEKFIRAVNYLQRTVGFDVLDEKKRYQLKKHILNIC